MTPNGQTELVAGTFLALLSAWMSAFVHVVVEVLGVPVPVIVAAIAGTLLARYYLPPLSFHNALWRAVVWVISACIGSQGVSWLAGVVFTNPMPVGALGFVALLTSLLGPKLVPVLVETSPRVLQRWLEKLGPGGTENQQGGNNDGTPK